MHRHFRSLLLSVGLTGIAWAALAATTWGQATPAAKPPAASPAKAAVVTVPTPGSFRKLAPGVMEAVDPHRELEETFDKHHVVELLAVDPTFEWAKNVTFRRDIWYLEFKFKPVRYIEVDIPQPNGRMERKLIRYLLYSVTNPGRIMHPEPDKDGTVRIMPVNRPIHFIPQFSLETQDAAHKVYPDRVMPLALAPIRQREDPSRPIYSSIEMNRDIAVGETVWGVATWESVDPKIIRYSIFVNGLTNAYRFTDDPGAYKAGDPIGKGRHLFLKTLKLNFWRPGDEFNEHEEEVRYGAPGEVDYEWIYR